MGTALSPYGQQEDEEDTRETEIPLATRPRALSAPATANAPAGAPTIPLAPSQGYATTTPSTTGPGNYLGRTITPGPSTDRIALAERAWNQFEESTRPGYERSLRSARENVAGRGQMGSGMERGAFADLANRRNLQLDTERQSLIDKATADSIADQYANVAIAQQQQGFQASQQQSANTQQLQREQLELARTTGLGNLDLARQQFGLSERLGLGNLTLEQARTEIDRQVRTGQLTVEQARQALAEKEQSDSLGLARDQFGLARQLGLGNMSIDQARLALDERVRTGELTIAQREQALRELQNSQQYDLQRSELTGRYDLGDPGRPANLDPSNGQQQTIMNLFSERLGRNPTAEELTQFTGMAANASWDAVGSAIAQRPRQLTAQTQSANQFQQQMAQALGIATMGDRTANRGIDANASLAQNELYLRIANLLASMGFSGTNPPPSGTSPTTPGPGSTTPGTSPPTVPPSDPNSPGIERVPREGEVARADATSDARSMVSRVLGRDPTPQELEELTLAWPTTSYDDLEQTVSGWR